MEGWGRTSEWEELSERDELRGGAGGEREGCRIISTPRL